MPELSENAKVILRHFRENLIPQFMFELPEVLRGLFHEEEECRRAQDELHQLGLINFKCGETADVFADNRVRATAINLDGQKYIRENDLT